MKGNRPNKAGKGEVGSQPLLDSGAYARAVTLDWFPRTQGWWLLSLRYRGWDARQGRRGQACCKAQPVVSMEPVLLLGEPAVSLETRTDRLP